MISEREMERILQEEQDEATVEKAISEFTGVPGGRYWEPGVEENPALPKEQWLNVEPEDLPFK